MGKVSRWLFIVLLGVLVTHTKCVQWYEEGNDGFTEKDLARYVENNGEDQLSSRFKKRYLESFRDTSWPGVLRPLSIPEAITRESWTGPTPTPEVRQKLGRGGNNGNNPRPANNKPSKKAPAKMNEEIHKPVPLPKPEKMVSERVLTKPTPEEWIFGRNSEDKLNLISWLIDGCFFYPTGMTAHLDSGKYEICNNSKKFATARDEAAPEFQTFDGFFNNPFKVDLGAIDTPLLRKVPPVYEDGSYEPVVGNRINPFKASTLMTRSAACEDSRHLGKKVACGSKTGKSAFLVFFGQQVVEELLDAQRPGCPPEYFNIEIPEGHEYRSSTKDQVKVMPFLRSRWAQNTGHSPGNPRQQLNEITPWIDGGLIYGTAKGWADVLRTDPETKEPVPHGFLASKDGKGYFPAKNDLRLPLANPPPPAFHTNWTEMHATANVDRFFMLGNPRGNENAFLLSFGVVLFRWHNHIAKYLHDSRPDWSGERVFQEARKWVIGTYQSIVMYNWLPEWLGDEVPPYKGYDVTVDPQIEQFFQTAAMRFGHTLVTPGAYMRDYACGKCKPIRFPGLGKADKIGLGAVRTCNIFWRPQEPLEMKYKEMYGDNECSDLPKDRDFVDIDRILMGMASQKAEREDNMIVEDLRGRVFGPLEFSRRDLMAVNIQRGRDHGTPDYNTAREAFGLERIRSVDDYMTKTGTATPREVVEDLERIHKEKVRKDKSKFDWDNIDVWTGGILETSYRPGPLFRAIIKDQFERIRNADRFWFENTKWKKQRFSKEQIERIKTLNVFDLVVSVTKMKAEDIQPNPFRVPDANFKEQGSPQCFNEESPWEEGTCETFVDGKSTKNESCWHFPQMDSEVNASKVEKCTDLGTYDYFDGSQLYFIITYLGIGLIVLGIGACVPLIASFRMKEKKEKLKKRDKKLRNSLRRAGVEGSQPYAAREWMGTKAGTRAVALLFSETGVLEVRSHKGELLRQIDLGSRETIELIVPSDGKHIIIKNPKEYDAVFAFDAKYFCSAYVDILVNKFGDKVQICDQSQSLHGALSGTVTREKRLARLEKFFKVVFGQAFAIDQPKGEAELIDPELIREVIHTELTRAEFADALGMKSESQFVEKMFDLIDRDKNRYISFREFLDMLVIFAKGTAEDKARLMFEMYDISRTGYLTVEEFQCMIRSMMEAANADIKDKELEQVTREMMDGIGLKRDSKVSLKEFQTLMSSYKDTLGYAQLSFSGVKVPESQQTQGASGGPGMSRKNRYETARTTMISFYTEVPTEDPGKATTPTGVKEIGKESEVTLPRSDERQGQISKWIELYRLQIFWGTMYTLVLFAVFAERAYVYTIEKEHGGLRQIAGYGVTMTRGSASAMMFTYATLLLTMCRNIITRLRETFLHRFIPFDSFVVFHKYVAVLGLIFTVIHVIGHGFNFYHISTQTASDLACLFRDYFRPTHVIPKFQYWAFETITGLTGVLLVFLAALIYSFSTNYARIHAFRMFWITHATYPLWYVLMILHGSGRLVQEPLFFNFLVGPLVIFVLDRIVSSSRKKVEIPVLRAELLPSNVTKLEFAKPSGFEYKSGQWIRIASSALNSNEFHPFTLSSAPHESTLTVHIRAVGPFTANIRRIYEKSLPKIYLDGPYGEGHQDWWRYEVSILVGGGIGVTPFASILKDVARTAHPRHCKKIYFLWVTRTQKQFEWLVDIIREIEDNKLISVHVFITQMYHKFDLRTVLLYIFERHFQRINNRSLFTGLKSVTHFGRPNFASFFKSLRIIHPNVPRFGVFSCGPFPMTKTVDEACIEVSNLDDESGSVFQHHFENF